jgi:hypothetical protein
LNEKEGENGGRPDWLGRGKLVLMMGAIVDAIAGMDEVGTDCESGLRCPSFSGLDVFWSSSGLRGMELSTCSGNDSR